MGKRETKLKDYLIKKYGEGDFKKPKLEIFKNSIYNEEIINVYKKLNGQLNQYPANYRGLDINCSDFIIELDEERHFNRYRLITLDSVLYKTFNSFDIKQYKRYCEVYELNCLSSASWSKNWETKTSKEQFGISDDEGCLKEHGSSRWKQRAFYDYLRDVTSSIYKIPIIRISIWDEINGKTVNELINCNEFKGVLELIESKVSTSKKV